jgi:hypothetical protein
MSNPVPLVLHCDATPARLLVAAKYLLQRSGQAPEIAELIKAAGVVRRRRRHAETSRPASPLSDAQLDALAHRLEAWGVAWPQRLQAVLTEEQGPEPMALRKAALPDHPLPWSQALWDRFHTLLPSLHAAVLAWLTTPRRPAMPPDDLGPLGLTPAIRDAFGQAALTAMVEAVPEAPTALTASEQAAIRYARQRAGTALRPLFHGLEADVERLMLDEEQRLVRQGVVQALEARHGAQRLTSALGQAAGSWERDWRRVARTELQEAFNQGGVATLISRHPSNLSPDGPPRPDPQIPDMQVYKIPSAEACVHCLRIWLTPDHSPRLYALADVLAMPTNVGRPAGEWTAQVGIIHPNCTEGPLLEYTPAVEPVFQRMRETWARTRRHEEERVHGRSDPV